MTKATEIKMLISNDVIFLTNEHYFLYSLCGAFFFDSLRRRTKMDAGEEARSRQYKGTAMSDDEEAVAIVPGLAKNK